MRVQSHSSGLRHDGGTRAVAHEPYLHRRHSWVRDLYKMGVCLDRGSQIPLSAYAYSSISSHSLASTKINIMPSFFASAAALALAAIALAAPAPQVTPAASLDKRAGSCSFSGSTGAAAVSKSKASCATITLSNVAVPSGTTLDLTKLNKGTKVIFEGTTSFGYKEWSGPLISVSGDSLTVSHRHRIAAGLRMQASRWSRPPDTGRWQQ